MKQAFTLIELLVVVLIIGILSAIALPQYEKSVEKSRMSEALLNISALERAIDVYLLANGYPSSGSEIFIGTSSNNALDIDITQSMTCNLMDECSNKYFNYAAYCNSSICAIHVCRDIEQIGRCEDASYQLDSIKQKGSSTWTKQCQYNAGKESLCKGLEPLGFTRTTC